MLKFRVTYAIKGAVHRPYYAGATDIWTNSRTEVPMRLYRKLKQGPFFDINSDDLYIQSIRYLTLVD